MIQFENVTKFRYEHGEKIYTLKNASFTIDNNARLAFLTTNKADKVIFLKLISGVDLPDSGRITSNGSISWILGKPVGISSALSGRSNIAMICSIYGMSRQKISKITNMIASFTELGGHIDDPVSTYSKEMKSRYNYSLSLMIRFDHTLSMGKIAVGDKVFRKKAKAAFDKKILKSGLILASSNLKLVRKLCDVCIVSKNGKVGMYDDIEEGIKIFKGRRSNKNKKKKNRNSTKRKRRLDTDGKKIDQLHQ